MDQALLQELLSGGSGLGLAAALSGLSGPMVPLSGGQFGPFGFSPYGGEANILGGGGGFGGGGSGIGPTSVGQQPESSLLSPIGDMSLGGGAGFLGGEGGGGGGGPQQSQPPVASATGGTTGDVLGLLKQALGLFGGGGTGSFNMSPATRAAFEAQRGGERQDLTGFLGGGGMATDLAGRTVPGGLTGIPAGGVFTGNTLPPGLTPDMLAPFGAGEFAGQAPGGLMSGLSGTIGGAGGAAGDVGLAAEAGMGLAGPGAAAGAAQTGAGTMAGLLPLANIAAGGLTLGLGDRSDPAHSWQIREAQERQGVLGGAISGLGSEEATMGNMVFPGAGLVLGALTGALRNMGVFGQHRTLSQKLGAEQLESGRIGDTMRAGIPAVEGSQTLEDFFANLQALPLGLRQFPTEFTAAAQEDPGRIWAASAPGGSWGQESALGVRQSSLTPSVQAAFSAAIPTLLQLIAGNPGILSGLPALETQFRGRREEEQAQSNRSAEADAWQRALMGPQYEPTFG